MPYVDTKDAKIRGAKLEYNLVDHCNFACAECSHMSPHVATSSRSLEQFRADLTALSAVYSVRRFRFVGGEPLLHRGILDFVSVVRESGIATEVEVVTNGVLLARAPDELYESIDRLTVSCYPDSRVDERALRALKSRVERARAKFSIERIDTFRRMQSAHNDDDERTAQIFQSCLIAHTWSCQTFHDGSFFLCSRPIYTGQYLQRLGYDVADFREMDGVPLHEPNLRERLIALLRRSEPLSACRYCLGTVGRRQPWRQLPPAQRLAPPVPDDASKLIDSGRLKALLAWRRAEALTLAFLPSRRLARSLSAALTALVGD
jgi:organic radical activating enzyme